MIIELLIKIKLTTSTSFRALGKQIIMLELYISSITETPRDISIRNWVQKIGYYELTKPKEKGNDWIIILDHSIQLGKAKLFVVMGIQLHKIDFNRPLQYQDLTPMLLLSKEKWNGEIIKKQIELLENEIGTIIYAIADYGSDIKKGLELSKIPHVRDIKHEIASIIEKLYKKDTDYQKLTAKMAEMRMKVGQTEAACILPPNQRKKSRFLNIDIISKWSIETLRLIECEKLSHEKIKLNITWLKELKPFIEELSEINQTICQIEKVVKNNGLSKKTVTKSISLLNKLNSEKGKQLSIALKNYFSKTMCLLPQQKKILCSSDIIESAFGKYKNYLSQNPMACLTNLSLCIAAFTSNLEQNEIKKALETIKIKDIKKWTNENIGNTILMKRREIYSKNVA